MRVFNTEGPVRPDDHYRIPPLSRMKVDEVLGFVRDKRYFGLHAPPQTGKTSALLALRDLLNGGTVGEYRCVVVNMALAEVAQDDLERGMRIILSGLAESARLQGAACLDDIWPKALAKAGPQVALLETLTGWCMAHPTPLVLLVDDVDSLVGDTLLAVLRQLRAGYQGRPQAFPQSVVLCGMHDIRDQRIRSSPSDVIAGGSPFSVVAKSLRLPDFTECETRALMERHTRETGQKFTDAARTAVWTQTNGQPWLVNALCAGACFNDESGRDRSRAIDEEAIHAARQALILSRHAHLDRLTHKLEEAQVRRVIDPILAGGYARHESGDLEHVRDLGLLALDSPRRIANPIYSEVVSRKLSAVAAGSGIG